MCKDNCLQMKRMYDLHLTFEKRDKSCFKGNVKMFEDFIMSMHKLGIGKRYIGPYAIFESPTAEVSDKK